MVLEQEWQQNLVELLLQIEDLKVEKHYQLNELR